MIDETHMEAATQREITAPILMDNIVIEIVVMAEGMLSGLITENLLPIGSIQGREGQIIPVITGRQHGRQQCLPLLFHSMAT